MPRGTLNCKCQNTTLNALRLDEALTSRTGDVEHGPISRTHDNINTIVLERRVDTSSTTSIPREGNDFLILIVRHTIIQGSNQTGLVACTYEGQRDVGEQKRSPGILLGGSS